jgi:HAD superfamily hydrolase (TIGR01509 family)
MFTTIFAEHGVSHPIEQMSKEKWARMSQLIDKVGIKAVPYAIELIETLHKNDFVLAMASGSPRTFINQVVQALSLNRYFSAMVSAEEVAHGKPAPDVFLEAAIQANISPTQCVIIEDGLSGMQAAAKANIPCIGLVQDTSKNYPASVVVTSLKDVTIELIVQLQEKQKLAAF